MLSELLIECILKASWEGGGLNTAPVTRCDMLCSWLFVRVEPEHTCETEQESVEEEKTHATSIFRLYFFSLKSWSSKSFF